MVHPKPIPCLLQVVWRLLIPGKEACVEVLVQAAEMYAEQAEQSDLDIEHFQLSVGIAVAEIYSGR